MIHIKKKKSLKRQKEEKVDRAPGERSERWGEGQRAGKADLPYISHSAWV